MLKIKDLNAYYGKSHIIRGVDLDIEKGEIVSTRSRKKTDIQRYRATKGDKINGQPLVVLINNGSASWKKWCRKINIS